MGTTPRTARGRATRQRILQAATELISERGVAGTSLDDVRELAQASKSQLYLYFPDRDSLLREVAESTCETVIEAQAEALSGFDSVAGIKRYLDATVALQVQQERPSGCPIASLAGQLADHDEQTRLILADGMDRWEEGLRTGLEAMLSRGELKPNADPAALANQSLVVLQGGLLLTQVRRDVAQMQLATDTVLALISAALA
jgi:TetR/AcrR family transcriptional regulator, transcriptional repressor for nem operon